MPLLLHPIYSALKVKGIGELNMPRAYRYLLDSGVSLGVDVSEKKTKVAVCLCGEDDTFSRETGKQLLDLLFDATDTTLQALYLKRNILSFPTPNGFSGKEILDALVKYLAGEELPVESETPQELADYLSERKLQLFIREAEKKGIQNIGEAREFANFKKNDAFLQVVEGMLEGLSEDAQERLNKTEDLQEVFFDWRGSANAIISGIKNFAKLVRLEASKKGSL